MRNDIKAKWVNALRSGKYNQIKGILRKEDSFCATGVLLNELDSTGWKKDEKWKEWLYEDAKGEKDSLSLSNWILTECMTSNKEMDKIVDMNDDGKSFEEIAEYIETYM